MATTTKRVKEVVDCIETREEMEGVVEKIARASIRLDGIMAEMDHELTEIRARFEPQINAYRHEIEAGLKTAKQWAGENPGEFGSRKSIEMVHGTVGYRTGTPKLKLISGTTWDRVLELLCLNKLQNYIRQKQEVDRERIIAERADLTDELLKRIGVKVVQEESFFVEPKRDQMEG